MMRSLRRFREEQGGASALEFALLAPMMIVIFFGLVETGQVILAGRRTSHAASTMSDLVAQQQTVAPGDLTDVFAAGKLMVSPMSVANLKLKVTSVTLQSNGKSTVDWSQSSGMAADVKNAVYTPPANMLTTTGDSVIIATSQYTLVQASKYVITKDISYSDVSYAKPRNGSQVTCPTC